ncbi:uncharacterized protein MYCGRDRAFT_41701 [Zymoseptoria tritici IPO323]|uniref:Metallo-beta-lactamase domain-containing protein n=1 Tax=Zymoseptoria tritici (strain CBS 115943 / IPO323) TaxID=336722 RepID=F9XB74_ZYMTI|nr:uncharacterized protein MYCGRDRAFT_41701 [Zymoseptoria tritici IPO323]EGP87394.1 hypothetical protein MYCGRDRAFT_41701 [Zymoseptoria tritici IPO323]
MASGAKKLIPSDPEKVMVIRKVTPDIVTFSTPFQRMGRISIGGRGTLVRLQNGSLAIFSPVALTDSVKETTASLGGPVKYIVAPDQEHHIFLEAWHNAYPQATILAPDTLPDYRSKQSYPSLSTATWHLFKPHPAPTTVSPDFDADFDIEYVSAHQNKELAFLHKPSRTLIQADILFNLPATEQMSKSGVSPTQGLLTKIFAGLMHTRGEATWQRRMIWYGTSAGDRKGFNASIGRIAKWDFDRLIPCHGDVIETGGKGIFDKVMKWHLDALKQQETAK